MPTAEIITALQGASKDTPAVIRLELWPGGTGNPPPPVESLTLAAYPVNAPSVQVASFWVVGDYANVRDGPAGMIVAQALRGTQIDVDMASVKEIAPNRWAKVVSANYAGNWVAINVLSATKPNP